tara:strand:+ start:635 stop:1657 length:1023 start_codon:yes stop_codon:yes gene_type:complete
MINYDKYKNHGLTGLANLGNTCYINSCMQVLSHCYPLNEIIDNLVNLNDNEDSILLIEWKKLKNLMWDKNCTIAPNRFINVIQQISLKKNRELFTGFAQNDLPEFLIFIFECFHNSLKREVNMEISGNEYNETDKLAYNCYSMMKKTYNNNYSEILKLFFGIHVSLIQSEINYRNLSINPEPYNIINLPIPSNITNCTIFDCFDLYTNKEYLEGDNSWYNEKTKKKENIYKSLSFWSLPDILIIDFKRFDNNNKKINTLITTPLDNIDLSNYVIGYNKENYIYNLFGIINHSGGSLGGHYTCFVKNANNKWYHFNDTIISEINKNSLITNKAYCYFYKKI